MTKYYVSTIASLIALISAAHGTVVIPPSFEELVAQAEVIFQGKVTEVKSQWAGEGAQRLIVTYVTFQIEDGLKGNVYQTYTIRMLGGTVDGESMGVSDAPQFALGDRDVLFVQNNGSQFIPLVGIMHGRFHVEREQSGHEKVLTNDGKSVTALTEFKDAIRATLETTEIQRPARASASTP